MHTCMYVHIHILESNASHTHTHTHTHTEPKLFDFGVTRTVSTPGALPSKHRLTQPDQTSHERHSSGGAPENPSSGTLECACTSGRHGDGNGSYSLVEGLEGNLDESSSGYLAAVENEATTAQQLEGVMQSKQPIGEQDSSCVTGSASQLASEPSSTVDHCPPAAGSDMFISSSRLAPEDRQEPGTIESSLETAGRAKEHVNQLEKHGDYSTTADIIITGIQVDSVCYQIYRYLSFF